MAHQDSLTIISRKDWGARQPKEPPSSTGQTNKFFIQHSAGDRFYTRSECEAEVRNIQNFHMDDRKWNDIGYNFVVGEDGNVYEGRGWCVEGAHTKGFNRVSHGICVLGCYLKDVGPPNQKALDALQKLLQYAVDQGHTSAGYTLHGHRDGSESHTESPGQDFYDVLTTWPHFGGPVSVNDI